MHIRPLSDVPHALEPCLCLITYLLLMHAVAPPLSQRRTALPYRARHLYSRTVHSHYGSLLWLCEAHVHPVGYPLIFAGRLIGSPVIFTRIAAPGFLETCLSQRAGDPRITRLALTRLLLQTRASGLETVRDP